MKSLIRIIMLFMIVSFLGCSEPAEEPVEPIQSLTLVEPEYLELMPVSLLDNRLLMHVPQGFSECTDRAGWHTRPGFFSMLLCHETGGVHVGVLEKENHISPDNHENYSEAVVNGINKKHPFAEWYRHEIMSLGKRECLVLDYRITRGRIEIRTLRADLFLDERILTVFFDTTLEFEYDWLEKGLCIISSFQVEP